MLIPCTCWNSTVSHKNQCFVLLQNSVGNIYFWQNFRVSTGTPTSVDSLESLLSFLAVLQLYSVPICLGIFKYMMHCFVS